MMKGFFMAEAPWMQDWPLSGPWPTSPPWLSMFLVGPPASRFTVEALRLFTVAALRLFVFTHSQTNCKSLLGVTTVNRLSEFWLWRLASSPRPRQTEVEAPHFGQDTYRYCSFSCILRLIFVTCSVEVRAWMKNFLTGEISQCHGPRNFRFVFGHPGPWLV